VFVVVVVISLSTKSGNFWIHPRTSQQQFHGELIVVRPNKDGHIHIFWTLLHGSSVPFVSQVRMYATLVLLIVGNYLTFTENVVKIG